MDRILELDTCSRKLVVLHVGHLWVSNDSKVIYFLAWVTTTPPRRDHFKNVPLDPAHSPRRALSVLEDGLYYTEGLSCPTRCKASIRTVVGARSLIAVALKVL
jgi:hypothetical protein